MYTLPISPNTASKPMNKAGVMAANHTINRLLLQFLRRTILRATMEHTIPKTMATIRAIMAKKIRDIICILLFL